MTPLLSDSHDSVTNSSFGFLVYKNACRSGSLFFKLRQLVKKHGYNRHLSVAAADTETVAAARGIGAMGSAREWLEVAVREV